MKLISWNVNGLRAIFGKGFNDFLEKEGPDILCIQETKIGQSQEQEWPDVHDGYEIYFSSAEKKGYSGVATYVKKAHSKKISDVKYGIGVCEFDAEGRFVITAHEKFSLYNIYIPSGTMGDVRQEVKYKFLEALCDHLAGLESSVRKRLVLCGDFNICHKDIDIHHPREAEKKKLSGFLPEEREWMDRFVSLGFVDTFRLVNGLVDKRYTWWSYRAGARRKNLGWRIDYFFVSESLSSKVKRAQILDSVPGSDHCPILLELF
ncbi:MAG: exodeoxyribonuclease III [Deltaproteobacteria bacterium]|nr:exodeoxyribonuclease III [Deltaproteobacteria bacterium]